MKIKRLVGLLADLSPHPYSDSVVLMWLNQCENSILTDVFLLAPEETVEYEEVTEQELLVPHPYDKLYLPYLQAQVAHANQEYDLYANLMALYNAYRYEYAQYIVNGADPGSGDAVRRGYYISAYGMAVAHGYAGTEEEWIASLKGAAGAKGEPGEPGKSAYEIAREQGFEGTEAEWIESMRGPAGRVAVYGEAPVDGVHYEAAVDGLVVERGLEILLTVASTNQGACDLAINGGEAYPLCFRPGYFSGSNYLRPELRMPLKAEMLLRGAEYVFRFDGYSWILQSYLESPLLTAETLNEASVMRVFSARAASAAEEEGLIAVPVIHNREETADGMGLACVIRSEGEDEAPDPDGRMNIPTVRKVVELIRAEMVLDFSAMDEVIGGV